MTPALEWYATNEVSEMTGASLRQLQWWTEHKWIQPKRGKSDRREWSADDVEKVRKILQLRRAGVRHAEIRRLKLLSIDFDEVVVVRKAILVGRTVYVPQSRNRSKRA